MDPKERCKTYYSKRLMPSMLHQHYKNYLVTFPRATGTPLQGHGGYCPHSNQCSKWSGGWGAGATGAPEETGPPITVCPRRGNPGTALFGLDCWSYRMRQCFSQVGEDCRPANGWLGCGTAKECWNRGAVRSGGSDRAEGFCGVKRSGSSEREYSCGRG